MIKYSLGVDISMKSFHACLSIIDDQQQVKVKASRKFTNNAAGFKDCMIGSTSIINKTIFLYIL